MTTETIGRLDGFLQAYPAEVFTPPSKEEREWLHTVKPGLQDRIAADFARHLCARALAPARDELLAMLQALDKLHAHNQFMVGLLEGVELLKAEPDSLWQFMTSDARARTSEQNVRDVLHALTISFGKAALEKGQVPAGGDE